MKSGTYRSAAIHRLPVEERRRRWRLALNRHYQKIRARVFAIFGSECLRCGFDDPRALCLDHIVGDGSEHRKSSYGKMLWLWAARHPAEALQRLQMLCYNCNRIKGPRSV